MDTDDLSEMAYDTLRLAEGITHDLTLELGVASRNYRTEDEYLHGMLAIIRDIRKHAREFLEDNELVGQISLTRFRESLLRIERHIKHTLQVPIKDRGPSS